MGGNRIPNPGGGGRRGGPGHGNVAQGRGNVAPPAIPEARPVRYFNDDGTLSATLLEDDAERVAKSLESMKATQLRRFYDDVVALRRRLDLEAKPGDQGRNLAFTALRAEFKMLKAKAVYANGRDRGKTFPLEMLRFVVNHVAAVNTARDFDAFCRHFQAVVAFHKFYAPRD